MLGGTYVVTHLIYIAYTTALLTGSDMVTTVDKIKPQTVYTRFVTAPNACRFEVLKKRVTKGRTNDISRATQKHNQGSTDFPKILQPPKNSRR